MLLDVAPAVALGGDGLADVAAVRAQPELFGHVASDPAGDGEDPAGGQMKDRG